VSGKVFKLLAPQKAKMSALVFITTAPGVRHMIQLGSAMAVQQGLICGID
jgi:hypothetical protein